MHEKQISITALSKLLKSENSVLSVAECQGCLTGFRCMGLKHFNDDILPHLNQLLNNGEGISENLQKELQQSFVSIDHTFSSDSFQIHLSLPEESQNAQLKYLSLWCEGWLLGYGLSPADNTFSEEVKEGIRDIRDISRVDYDIQIDPSESDQFEKDFYQLVSHIEVIIELVFLENNSIDNKTTPTKLGSQISDKLH